MNITGHGRLRERVLDRQGRKRSDVSQIADCLRAKHVCDDTLRDAVKGAPAEVEPLRECSSRTVLRGGSGSRLHHAGRTREKAEFVRDTDNDKRREGKRSPQ